MYTKDIAFLFVYFGTILPEVFVSSRRDWLCYILYQNKFLSSFPFLGEAAHFL